MKKRILMLTWTSRKIRGFCPFIFKNEISWIIHLGYNISHLLCFRSVKKVIISQVTSTSFFLWFYYRNWTVDVVLHLQKRKHVLRFGNLIGFSVSSKIYKRIYHTIHSVGNISHCSMQYSFCYWNNWKKKPLWCWNLSWHKLSDDTSIISLDSMCLAVENGVLQFLFLFCEGGMVQLLSNLRCELTKVFRIYLFIYADI